MRCLRTPRRACPPPAIFEPGCGADPVGIDPRISKVLHTKGSALLGGNYGNYAKQSSEIIVGTSSEEQLVRGAIGRGSASEFNSPELIDVDHFVIGVLQGAGELAGYGIESVDRAGIGVV